MKFKVGDKVKWLMTSKHADGRPAMGEVISIASDGDSIILWDDETNTAKHYSDSRLIELVNRKKPTIIVRIKR